MAKPKFPYFCGRWSGPEIRSLAGNCPKKVPNGSHVNPHVKFFLQASSLRQASFFTRTYVGKSTKGLFGLVFANIDPQMETSNTELDDTVFTGCPSSRFREKPRVFKSSLEQRSTCEEPRMNGPRFIPRSFYVFRMLSADLIF